MKVTEIWRYPVKMRRLTAAILAAGFGSAVVIYITAGPESENPLGYDPLQTKSYLHDLEMYGGKANVLAAEFMEWFTGLWQGRSLAWTVAVITILVVLALRFFAGLPAAEVLDDADGDETPPRRLRGLRAIAGSKEEETSSPEER